MANLLYQQIEMLSREKHIEPEVVISAIEDAMVVAARKFYKSDEDLRGKFNQESGQVDVYAVQTVVEESPTRSAKSAWPTRRRRIPAPRSARKSSPRSPPRFSDASPRKPPSR